MKTYTITKPVALILMVLILSNGLSIFAQTKRAAVKPKAASPSVAAGAETLVSENGSAAMNAAWQSGKLPAPLPVPSQNADAAAAILAQKVAAKSNESIPALLTALQMSGFFVTDQSGKILSAPADGKGQGLTINSWEVASAAKMYGDCKSTNLAELGEKLQSIPAFKEPHDSTSESSMSFSMEGIVIEGTIDPKNPTVLQGSQSYTDDAGMEVVIRWSLRRCS